MYGPWSEAALVCAVTFPALATIATALRLWSRKVSVAKIGIDDYLVVLALIFITTKAILVIYGANDAGIGQKPSTMTMDEASKMSKFLYFDVLFVHLSIGIVKISVLSFYKRIFATPQFHRWANVVMVLAVLWTAAATFTLLFSTWPFSNWWSMEKGPSINMNTYLQAFAALDIALDVLILSLPVPVIKNLNMNWRKKCTIIAIFWLGVFCTASAAVRLYFAVASNKIVNPTDEESLYWLVNSIIWCLLEPCVCIITACLPTFGPLLQKMSLFSLASSIRSYIWPRSKTVSTATQTSESSGASTITGEKTSSHGRVSAMRQTRWDSLYDSRQNILSFDFDLERAERSDSDGEIQDLRPTACHGSATSDYAGRAPTNIGGIRVERSFASMSEARKPGDKAGPPWLPDLQDLGLGR